MLLAAIASPRRREILRLIWDDERQAGAIASAMPDVTHGAVSLHLRALLEAGAVDVRTEGRCRYYTANRKRLQARGGAAGLERMWDDALWKLKLHAELEESRRGPARRHRRKKS